jgi:hypothetical protein
MAKIEKAKQAGVDPKALVSVTASDGSIVEVKEGDLKDIERGLLAQQGSMLENPQFMQIRIKHQGTLRYMLPETDENGENKLVKTFAGVIIFNHRMNSYWDVPYEEGTEAVRVPRCFAIDAKRGSLPVQTVELDKEQRVVYGECGSCFYNAWGSDARDRKGKACRNMWRLFIYQNKAEMLPYQLTLPPSSLKFFQQYAISLMSKNMPIEKAVTSFTLARGNMDCSLAQFAVKETLNTYDFIYYIEERRKLLNFMKSAIFYDESEAEG